MVISVFRNEEAQPAGVGGEGRLALPLALSMWQAEVEGGHSLGSLQQELSSEEELNR